MADAATTRYAFVKPEVGASADSWGGKLNADMDDLDALLGAITTTGSANAYVLTTGLSLAAYVAGQSFDIKANFSNSGAVTIAVDGLATKAITKNGTTALASGDIVSGAIYRISYDGTQFQLVGTTATGVYQPLDALLTAIAALTTADDRMLDFTGTDTVAVVTYATVLSNIGALNQTAGDVRYAQLAASSNTLLGADLIQSAAGPAITQRDTGGSNIRWLRRSASGVFQEIVSTDNFATFTVYREVTQSGAIPSLVEEKYPFVAPPGISLETTGVLTSASRNRIVRCSGNITLPASGMTDGDIILIQPRGTARTITRPAAHTMYISNTDAATGTSGAHNDVVATYEGSSKWTLSGNVV